jgi:hypothetical protein
MKLPIPFLNSKKHDSDYYLALILTEDKASAVILKESDTVLKSISTHEEFFPHSIEDLSLENFIDVVDKTISRAEEVLPPQIETHKTVFGVKDRWVEKETKKIKKEYLDKLKKVCDALDLQPIGFMVTTEAVSHLVQDEEGAPLSAIMAEIGDKQVSLSLLRGGKVIESISSTLMHSAPHTVDKLLSHFTVPVLPARIVLYLNKPDEEASQAFISHHWSKSLPFLHVPQVTVLPAGFDTRAVMFGAATQMGFTVHESHHEALPKLTSEEKKEEEAIAEEETVEDIEHKESLEENEHKETIMDNIAPVPDPENKSGDFGFVINGEPKEEIQPHHSGNATDHEGDNFSHHNTSSELDLEEGDHEDKKHHGKSIKEKFPILASLPAISMPKNLKMPNVGGVMGGLKGNKAPLKIIIPVVAVLLLIIGSSIFYINNVKATVSLTVKPNIVTENASVTFSANSPSDFSENVVQARNVTTAIDATLSTNATGKKDVGEKAKGSVTIYNNSDDPINLSSGTELKASNGEIFVLDKDVRVVAASGDIFTGTKPGTTDTSVTAKELGTEGNIPSGTRFTIGSTSSLAARNDSAFTGGTKKNVTVVSKSDMDKLRNDLAKSVESDAQEKLLAEAKTGETVLPVVGDPTLEQVKFDKKEGDEATKVTLTASVVFLGMAYTNKDLEDYAQTVLKSQYADDIRLAEKSVKSTVDSAELTNEKTVTASLKLEGGLLPQIDTDDIIENVKDKSLGDAKNTVANLPQVSKTDITFSPPVLLLPNVFPRLPNQIAVEVKTE